VAALTAAGIPFELCPGVSSALAAPLAAGFPLTHPQLSRAFAVTSAHDPDALDWAALAVRALGGLRVGLRILSFAQVYALACLPGLQLDAVL
jgi:siroheme synthase